jgi:DNA-directed RNA polymerase specialized sigma24 family protein
MPTPLTSNEEEITWVWPDDMDWVIHAARNAVIKRCSCHDLHGSTVLGLLRGQLFDAAADDAPCTCRLAGVGRCQRHRNRDHHEVLVDEPRAARQWIDRHETSPRAMARHEQVMAVWDRLTAKQRDAIEARVVYAGNDSEAARNLGIDESTYRAHIRAARKKIEAAWAADTPESPQ